MSWHEFLIFASDAELALLWGGAFLLFAVVAFFAERRRVHRAKIDRVGCMPWVAVFLASFAVGGTLFVMGLIGLLRG